MDDDSCGEGLIDHSILIVGYGSGPDVNGTEIEYWIIKNSHGTNWGEGGFGKIKMLTEDREGMVSTIENGGYAKLLGTSFYAPIFKTDDTKDPCNTIPPDEIDVSPREFNITEQSKVITWPNFYSSCNITYLV